MLNLEIVVHYKLLKLTLLLAKFSVFDETSTLHPNVFYVRIIKSNLLSYGKITLR